MRQRALTAKEVINMEKKTFAMEGKWAEFLGQPETTGVWFVWGNSGNGKSSFAMQLCRELARHDRVMYNSLEEGTSLTMQRSLVRHGMAELGSNFVIVREDIEQLTLRLRKRKSPRIVIIDSFQYSQLTYSDYIVLKDNFPDKLFIFISHADGQKPLGNAARRVMYDAALKVWIEGYKATSKGRFIGSTGEYIIWTEGANTYWGERNTNTNTNTNI